MTDKRIDDWNPLDASVLKDQRGAYDEMRERCPVARSEFLGWSLFRHEDIAAVLANPETYSNASRFLAIPNGLNAPEHGQYRSALDPNFSHAQMLRIEPLAREIAASLIAPMLSGDEVDFVGAFALPFSVKTLCATLGWPEQQWQLLGRWGHDSQEAAFGQDAIAGKALADLFDNHVKTNLKARRSQPHGADEVGDATDALLSTRVEGVLLDDDQIVSVLRNWTAGHGTVEASLGILVLHLAQDEELQDRLRREPSLIPIAVEEILRVDGPLVANPRTTTREVEIQGRTIGAGERLSLMWIAGDRDPRAFFEPDTSEITRKTDDSLVWGHGAHLCQGAPLARLEMRVALEELLSHTRSFELSGAETATRAVYPGNGLTKLVLRLHRPSDHRR